MGCWVLEKWGAWGAAERDTNTVLLLVLIEAELWDVGRPCGIMAKSLSRFHHILVYCKSGFSFNFADGSSKCEFSSGLGKQFRDFCTDYRMKSMHLEIFLQDGLFTDRVLLWSYYQPNRQEPSWTTGGKASSIPILLLLLLNYHPTQLIGISSSRFFGQNLCYQGKCWASECFLPSITFLWTPKSTFMLLSVQYTVRRH